MGHSQSKEVSQTVFAPASNVQLTDELKSALDDDVHTDFALRQYSAKQIEGVIAARLKEAQQVAKEKLEAARGRVEAASKKLSGESSDDGSLASKLKDLEESLASRPKRGQGAKETESARANLLECIKKNKDHVLDCRDELAAFERQVAALA